LYYVVRPKVLELTGAKEFGYYYFSQTLLPAFLRKNPQAEGWKVHCDARGTLTEPHTGKKIPLGTAEVAGYMNGWRNGGPRALDFDFELGAWDPGTNGPYHRYSALIIVEKEGLADILAMVGIGRKYDVAIVGNKGHSVEAEYRLADRLKLPIFTLHDFDRNGLTIGENLRNGTKRHTYVNEFPVIEIGLRMHQIKGLEDEPITDENLKSVGDERLRECGATDDEIAFLRERRVELNALTTAQLVEMVEAALDDYGIKKVIPEADALKEAWREALTRRWVQKQVDEIATTAKDFFANSEAPDDLEDQVREILEQTPTMSWDAAILETV
jgi:hypothetical protein